MVFEQVMVLIILNLFESCTC